MAIRHKIVKSAFSLGASVWALSSVAIAQDFAIPGGDLQAALANYSSQTGVNFVVSSDELRGVQTKGVSGNLSAADALSRLLRGTGFEIRHYSSGKVGLSRGEPHADNEVMSLQLAQAAPPPRAVETVTVTSSKLGGADVQSIPIAITALSQEQLTATQTAGGPDLVKQVPNMTFTKTNFSGYSIQIRGIGTQAISVTTDPAVAVAFNDIPFIRNHFFEQEFYDVSNVEILRGPQGTLYGRNATAGVVNLSSAPPTDQFEAMASGEIGNYHQRRFEGMINLPIVDDRVDLRIAGEWTKRQGYSFNELTDQRIDGRDLWSGRVSLSVKPTSSLKATLVWEHFSEDDDRMRTAKQLCKKDTPPTSIGGHAIIPGTFDYSTFLSELGSDDLSQGCSPTSLYSPDAFQVPYGFSLPYVMAAGIVSSINDSQDPYASTTQSRNLRVIESALNPSYRAKNEVVELNADYSVTPSITLTSQTGYNQDFLWSAEDYNRFNTSPHIFQYNSNAAQTQGFIPDPDGYASCQNNGGSGACGAGVPIGTQCTAGSSQDCIPAAEFCDPQLGCSDRLVGEDLSEEHAWQLSQEFRLSTNFSGPLNFSVGGNYLHYETEENYYVFINTLSAYAARVNELASISGTNPLSCLQGKPYVGFDGGYQNPNPKVSIEPTYPCVYIDPNPITNLNNYGHNYFLSQNPYTLNSYAGFGEVNYNFLDDLKLTGGIRWTEDRKHFTDIPSEVITGGYGYPTTGVVDQQWGKITGRAVVNWSPKLDFTDQTLIYGSYSRGYKAGGANPPGAIFSSYGGTTVTEVIHPLTFRPEFVNAFEVGSKNTLLDGALTLNGDAFYYDYKDYQISEIVDRTSVNLNFDAAVKGAEIEATYEPLPGLRFNFAGGYEHTRIANGQSAIDLMDRSDSANHPDWLVLKPFPTEASNCVLPAYVVEAILAEQEVGTAFGHKSQVGDTSCEFAYNLGLDPATGHAYVANPTIGGGNQVGTFNFPSYSIPAGYPGFDPSTAPNGGEGFAKGLGGNELPNAPPLTVSFGAQYSLPLSSDWAGTLRGDYYWQDYSWTRVFNDNPYDRLRGYTNVNLTLIFTNQNGWQIMLYDKNVFNTTAITGAFLNSDDSGLTTNVFLTDPKLIGVRVTKNW